MAAIDRDNELLLKYKVENFLQYLPALYPLQVTPPEVFLKDHMTLVFKTRIVKELLQHMCPGYANIETPLKTLSENMGNIVQNSPDVKNMVSILRDIMYEQITAGNVVLIERIVNIVHH